MKFDKIQPGMRLWDVKKSAWPTRHKWATWPVDVVEVDGKERRALISWNYNPARWVGEVSLLKYRAKNPNHKNQ